MLTRLELWQKQRVCASSPCVTVAIWAEPHGPVLVRDSKAVKRVCSNHQEEIKHLKEKKEGKKCKNQQIFKILKKKKICIETAPPHHTHEHTYL